jgi:hypothetical protein
MLTIEVVDIWSGVPFTFRGNNAQVEQALRHKFSGQAMQVPKGDLLGLLRELSHSSFAVKVLEGEVQPAPHLNPMKNHKTVDPWPREGDFRQEGVPGLSDEPEDFE